MVSSVAGALPPRRSGPIQLPLVCTRELTGTPAALRPCTVAWTIKSHELGPCPAPPRQLQGSGAGFALPLHPTAGWCSYCVCGGLPWALSLIHLVRQGCTQLAASARPGPGWFPCRPGAGSQLPPNSAPLASHASFLPSGPGARESSYTANSPINVSAVEPWKNIYSSDMGPLKQDAFSPKRHLTLSVQGLPHPWIGLHST